ncbi:MAG: hypothetical protein REI78_12220 [Pedobacter sp.]|nr:hypothetical protein [Pedobacter sp.]MDQ8053789.1 hypothetical protein [Pedobacter sp.]
MMDLDEELKSRIKAVFDNLDDGESDKGWAELRTKYPDPKRKLPLYWITGIAATLALVCGLWLLRKPAIVPKNNENSVHVNSKANKKADPSSAPADSSISVAQERPTAQQIVPVPFTHKQQHSPVNTSLQQVTVILPQPLFEEKRPEQISTEKPMLTATLGPKTDQIHIGTTGLPLIGLQPSPPLPQQQTTTLEFLKSESQLAATNADQHKKSNSAQKRTYEVFTGTFLNYYGENQSKVNAGFGLNTNVKLASKLYVSIGAGFSKNNISFNHNAVSTESPNALSTVAPTQGFAASNSLSFVKSTDVSLAKLQAQLLSLDFPVVMKFYPAKKQHFYIAAGFNSNSYFAQKYAYTYAVVTRSAFATSSYNREEIEKKDFSSFEFANSAIFAIGVTQKVGQQNHLIFEPYFKPALSQMGDKNLKINTIGLNLRFSFTPNRN